VATGSETTAEGAVETGESRKEPIATPEPETAVVNDAAPAEGAAPDAASQPIEPVAPVNVADPVEGPAEPVADVATDEAAAAAESPAAPAALFAVPDRPEPTTMEELLAQQSGDIPSLKHGDVVEGTIVRIDKDEMLVDVGAKSEGVVSNRELYGRNAETQPELSVGDTVLVYVLQPESTDGHAVLSLRRAGLERKWRAMQEQFDAGDIIEAPVIDHNKGGLIVDCGIRGFVPISQIVDFPRRPQNDQPRDAAQEIAEKLQPYVGRRLRLKILEVNRKANRLILSEKVALYEERREKRDELFSSLQVGQQVKGTVRSIAPFGVFIDLGGIDGLVHKSELSWNKVNSPEGAYEVGDEVEAEVIDINHERGRISLSIRRMQPDPWQSTVGDLKVGDLVDGTVTKIVNFGAFVRVKDGLEGLIHISELSHQRVAHPGDVVHEGQTLKLKVISLDSERHRLGLSLKQAEEAPVRPPRERRVRTERSAYDRSQAIQEPEGGIDNTLAAAFAQVRQQIAEQDAAEADEVDVAPEASVTDEASAANLDVPPAAIGDDALDEVEPAAAAPVDEVVVASGVVEDTPAELEAPDTLEATTEADLSADVAPEADLAADVAPDADVAATSDEVAAAVEDDAAAAADDAVTAAGDDVAVGEPVEGAEEAEPAKA
jgi:small subunit ribosomal protein S1